MKRAQDKSEYAHRIGKDKSNGTVMSEKKEMMRMRRRKSKMIILNSFHNSLFKIYLSKLNYPKV